MASHRRTLAAAVATILASVSLYPIFYGSLWFFAGVAAVAVVAAAGTATRVRRLPWPAATAGVLLALLLYLNLAFSNARSFLHLLPTPASVDALAHLVGTGFTESSKYAPPVPELRGMVLLAAAGIGITAMLTDLIAVRLQSAALAGLPLLLLFTEPFTLSISRGFAGTAVAFIAGVGGYLALLSSEARDRIREWEQPDPDARSTPDTRPLAAAGRRVGFASVVIALCLPLFLPGLHVTRLFGGQPGIGGSAGGGSGGASASAGFPDPNVQMSQELKSTKATPVLYYSTATPVPDYLQLYVADKLTDGDGWQMFAQPESLVSVSPRMPAPPGLASEQGLSKVTTSIAIASGVGQDELAALPVPYPATTVTAQGTLRADQSTLMVLDPGVTLSNLRYSVTSLDLDNGNVPTPAELESAPSPPASIRDTYTAVPKSYLSLLPLAKSVVANAKATTPYAEALALQDWLQTFTYTLNAPTVLNAAELTHFLKVTKQGYCQQFSFAMAVLARLLGIPSRVAYGFTAGSSTGAETWEVTTHDAHAWPELYFSGYGWLRFEPTPPGDLDGQGTASVPQYATPLTGPASQAPGTQPTTSPTLPTGSATRNPAFSHLLQAGFDNGTGASYGGGGGQGTSPWEVFGFVLAGLLVLAVVAPWCARLLVRQRRWHVRRHRRGPRAGERGDSRGGARPGSRGGARPGSPGGARGGARDAPGERARDGADVIDESGGTGWGDDDLDVAWAHAAWRELRDDLVDHGTGYLPSETPRAAAARAGTTLTLAEPARAALGRIAMAEERARYAARPTDGSGLRRDSTTVRRAIAAAVPRRSRWRARLLPPSVVGPALGTAAAAADIFGRLSPEWLPGFRRRGGRGGEQI